MIDCVLLINTLPVLHKDIKRMKRFVKRNHQVSDSSISTLDLSSYTDQCCIFVENKIKRYVM